jgi:hypothetical protein
MASKATYLVTALHRNPVALGMSLHAAFGNRVMPIGPGAWLVNVDRGSVLTRHAQRICEIIGFQPTATGIPPKLIVTPTDSGPWKDCGGFASAEAWRWIQFPDDVLADVDDTRWTT